MKRKFNIINVSALHIASEAPNNIIQLLLEYGANPNIKDNG